jgi:hypothetical protein
MEMTNAEHEMRSLAMKKIGKGNRKCGVAFYAPRVQIRRVFEIVIITSNNLTDETESWLSSKGDLDT